MQRRAPLAVRRRLCRPRDRCRAGPRRGSDSGSGRIDDVLPIQERFSFDSGLITLRFDSYVGDRVVLEASLLSCCGWPAVLRSWSGAAACAVAAEPVAVPARQGLSSRPMAPRETPPRLTLLGAPALRAQGRLSALSPRDALLFAWLAVEGPTARGRLAGLLWPDSTSAAARNSLRQRLHKLRQQLGFDLIVGRETLALADGVEHDLEGADQLLAGVALEAGGDLAGWLEEQRHLRRARAAALLVERADAAERAGDWPGAIVHAAELVALDPLSEAAHRRVVRLHYLAGDRAAALLAFDRCERMLKDEVGARPDAETMALLGEAAAAGLQVLAIDDLQFADAASVELLAAASAERRCSWVLAMRPHELAPAAAAWLASQDGAPDCERIELVPLDRAATLTLVQSLAVPGLEAVAAELHRRTGGNPMFLLESVKALLGRPGRALAVGSETPLAWPRPEGVQRVIQQRLTRLSPLAIKLVRCAAVAGPDFSPGLVGAVLGLAPLDQADAWSELEAAQVLRDQSFAHDLIAEAAAALVPAAVARPLHAAVAAHLEVVAGEPVRIAEHWTAAGLPLKAVPHLKAAAERAFAVWRADVAGELLQRAACTLQQAGERRAAFGAWFLAAQAWSEHEDAGVHLRACLGPLDALTDDDGQRAQAALAQAVVLVAERRLDEMRELLLEALPRAQRAGLADVEVELLWDLTVIYWERRELADAAANAERALARLADVDLARTRVRLRGTRLKLLHAMGLIGHARGSLPEGNVRLAQAYEQALVDGELVAAHSIGESLAVAAMDAGDLPTSATWLERIAKDCARAEIPPGTQAAALLSQLTLHAHAGELGAALERAERGLTLVAGGHSRHDVPVAVRCFWLYGELGRNDFALKGLRALHRRADISALERLALDTLLMHLGHLGHLGEAVDVDAVLDRLARLPDALLRARWLCLAQPACDPGRVLPLLHIAAAGAREQGAHGLWVTLESHRALVLGRLGRDAEAAAAARSAWQRIEQGVSACALFPRIAAMLCTALARPQPELAWQIALRGQAWVQHAASTLPGAWRDVFLERRGLPAAALALLR